MEKLAKKLANDISRSLGYDGEKEAVIAYGLIAMIQIFVTVLVVLLLGILINAPVEALTVCFSVSILRQYSGGAHAGSAELCTGIGVVYCTAAAFASRKLLLPLYSPVPMATAMIIIYIISFLMVYQYAPVDSPQKPIRTEQKRKRMRKGSFIILSVYFALSMILFVLGYEFSISNSYAISLLLGVSWQIFTLSSAGASLLHNVDKLFRKEVS